LVAGIAGFGTFSDARVCANVAGAAFGFGVAALDMGLANVPGHGL